ncbi:MAG: hypothetical protein ACM3ZE_07270 [Myxococcales bacterium]
MARTGAAGGAAGTGDVGDWVFDGVGRGPEEGGGKRSPCAVAGFVANAEAAPIAARARTTRRRLLVK